jgi:hypothetical protein
VIHSKQPKSGSGLTLRPFRQLEISYASWNNGQAVGNAVGNTVRGSETSHASWNSGRTIANAVGQSGISYTSRNNGRTVGTVGTVGNVVG